TSINSTARFYEFTFTVLPAGDYQVKGFANDTSNAVANTAFQSYSISKNTSLSLTLTIDGTAGDVTKTYPNNVVTVACSETNNGDTDASYVCSRDNATSLGTGSSVSVVQDLTASATAYSFQYNITQSTLQNYTAPVSLTRQLTVNKGILNDTGLNASQTVTYETQSTVTSGIASTTFKGDDDVTYQLWRGNSLVDNTLPLSEALVLGQGTNNYKVNTTVGAFTNWTANASINTTTVTVNAKTVQVSLNGINNITYPNTNVTINCGAATIASTANTCVLLRNGTDVTSASNNTVMDLAAGLWNITVTGTAGSGNYSANTTGLTSFFNIAKNTTRVTLSISPSSPVTYLTSTTATGSEANKGDSDVTYRLYRESGNDTGAASETITLGAGTHLYRFNATSGSNWSVNATGETLTLTVNQGASDIALYLNGTRADKTYAQYQFANFTAQLLNATGKTISLTSNMTGFGILSGSSSIILNTTNLTQNGTFNMTAYWSGDANFTSDSETWYATSSPLTLTASLNSLSPTSINQAETSTAKAGCSVTGNSITNVYIELQADGAPIQTTAGGNLRVNGSNAVSAGSLADGGVVNATWTITGNNAGSYSIRTKCNSTEAGDANSGTSTLTVVDVTLPSASNALNSTPSTYNPNVKSHFNITWTDDVGISKVFLESNYTGTARNYTMNRIPSTNVYNYNETLPAGGFYWKSYANDTANNMVASSTITFIISKDMPMIVPVFNNRTERHGEEFNASNTSHNFYEFGESFDKGIILNLTANISVSSLELRLSANYTGVNQDIATGTGVVTNLTDTGNLQLGVYNVTAYYTGGNSNYSAVSNAFFLFVHSKYTNQTINFTAFVPTFVNASVANVTFSFVTNSTITLAGVNTTIEKVNPVHTEIPHVAIGRYVLLNASEDLRNTLSYYIFNISYLESEVPADVDESTLRLYFFNGTGWMRFASAGDGVDTANNVVYGNITHFSEFGVGGLKATGQSCTAGSDCATGICCSSICSASCGATTTTTPPSTGGGGTTPISPGGPVIILPKGIISVAKTPILVSVGTGDSNIVNIKIKNTGTTTLHNLRLSALGEANSWISVSPERVNLLTNEAATFTLAISIPATVTSQDYQVEMDINSDEINDKSTFILRVVSFSSHQERPLITRTAEIDLEAVETAVTIKIINPTRSYAVVQITEAIDKQIAKSADDINFITKPTSILEKDPQVLWNVKDIKAGETRTIFYTASKIPSFSELVFWPFDEITLIKERFPKGMKVVRVLTPTMYGNKDILKITVQNEDVDSHTLKIMPEFPEDWTVEPKDIEEVLPSKKQKEYTLTLDSSRAKLGSYIIQITFVWDGAEIIKEYSITNKSIFDRIVDLIVSLGNYLKQLLGL
ncbi:MAG: hypothetical protein HY361_00700, partial [Candidatus Aenigmarchaeota archaeon]|nr:hypothetical protein [Candidatus Aenigmarchaeota archaeon]